MELTPGFRYRFALTFGSEEGVVATAGPVVYLDNGRRFLALSVQELTPLFRDEFKSFTAKERAKLAKTGAAMSDGSYPIQNVSQLHDAVQAYGRSPDEATKAHIVKRAKALGATDALPDDWEGSTKNVTAAAVPPIQERLQALVASVRARV